MYWMPTIHCKSDTLINEISFILYLAGHIRCLKVCMIVLYIQQFLGDHIRCLMVYMIFCVRIFGQSHSMFKGVYDILCALT